MTKHQSLFFLCIVFLMLAIRSKAQITSSNMCFKCYPDSTVKLYEDSVKIVDNQITLHPDSSLLYSLRGFYRFAAHDMPNAKKDLQKAIDIDSTNLHAYKGFGYLYHNELNYSIAIQYYALYLLRKPDDCNICFYHGVALTEIGKIEDAIPYFIKALKDSTFEFLANTKLAYCYSELRDNASAKGHYQIALEKIEEAIRKDTSNAYKYFWRAYIKTQLNDYRNVLADYDRSILLDSTDAETYFFRAIARKSLNKPKESCADLYTSLLLGYSQEAYDLLCENCKALCQQYTNAHPDRQDKPARGFWVH